MVSVVIVVPDEAVRTAHSLGLIRLGHEVRAFKAGCDALPVMEVAPPQVCIIDLEGCCLGGAEFLRLARTHSRNDALPGLFLTSGEPEEYELPAPYLRKQFGLLDLEALVLRAVRPTPPSREDAEPLPWHGSSFLRLTASGNHFAG